MDIAIKDDMVEDEIAMWDLEHLRWACIRAFANTSLYVRRSPWLSPTTQPDFVKTYQCCPTLFACRIFIPSGHNSREALPLIIRVHGGGFVINNPAADDPIARYLADNAQCAVVSIDYSKAPQKKFPAAYEDVVAQSLSVINDPDLPLDRNRVVLCGSSAGGNLVLAAAQDQRLRSKLLGVAAIYPLVDLVPDGEAKMATRPDPSVPDFIGNNYSNITRLYLDAVEKPSLTDTRLSPTYFATRDSLPSHLLLVGSEHDMLCYEAEAMAIKIAILTDGVKINTGSGWRAPGVQWHKIFGQPHAFDAIPAKAPDIEMARVAAMDEMYSVTSEWLTSVFSESIIKR